MGRFLFLIVAVIGIGLAIIILAPDLIPASTYKDRLETAASNSTGRTVTIGDDISVKIFPKTAFEVTDLKIANADGFKGETFAEVGAAQIGVRLLPLLSGKVEVDQFVLNEPTLTLIRAKSGAVNWNLLSDTPTQAEATNAGTATPRDVSLGDVRIVNGSASYTDEKAGTAYVAENINLSILLNSLDEPLEIDGALTFQDQPSNVDIVLTNLRQYMRGENANLKADIKIGDTTAGADLTVRSNKTIEYSGPISFSAPDLAQFTALTGTELADAPGYDNLSVNGAIEGNGDALRLSDALITFDDIDAQGAINLDWTGARPKASGVLSTKMLDLRPYMPPPSEAANGFPAWSTDTLNFAALRNMDADIDLSTDAIMLNDLNIGESRLKLKVDRGRLEADIPELAMYGGLGSGRFVVNARRATPSFAGNFDMSAVNAQPLSLDMFKHDNLLGLGDFKFDFIASGKNQAAIMSSIDGSGGFDLSKGALKGVSIVKLVNAVGALRQANPAAFVTAIAGARDPSDETEFTSFLSNFNIENGLVKAPTISMAGPYFNMTGTGTIDLPRQRIDIRLAPNARSTLAADAENARTYSVPLRVGGTFSEPTIGVDVERYLTGGGASQLLELFRGGTRQNDQADAAANSTDEPQQQESLEETLVREALGAFFGPAPAEDDTDKK